MLTFGETLDGLIKQHNLKSKEVALKIGMNEPYICRLKKGQLMPNSFEMVKNLSRAMNLSDYEEKMLVTAYKATKLGADYISIEGAIQDLYNIKFPDIEYDVNNKSIRMNNGDVIKGMENIVDAICLIMDKSEKIDCLFIPQNKKFCNLLRRKFKTGSLVNLMIYLDDSEDNEAANISILNEVLSFLLIGRSDVRYKYKSIAEHYQATAYPYVFMNENELLLIEKECQKAFYFNNEEFVNVYREKFKEQFAAANPFVMMITGFESYLEKWHDLFSKLEKPHSDDLLIIEKWPCIIHEASHSDIRYHISDIEKNDLLARTYMKFLDWSAERLHKQKMMFSIEGIREYFDKEVFHEYSRHITKPISKALRRELFAKLIKLSKIDSSLVPEIMLESPYLESNVRVINVWKSGIVLIILDFDEAFRIAVLQEKTIASALWNYYHGLKKCGIVLSKAKSIEIMEDEYRKEIENSGKGGQNLFKQKPESKN